MFVKFLMEKAGESGGAAVIETPVVETPAVTPEPVATPEATATPTPEAPVEGVTPVEGEVTAGVTAEPQYTPNYKFKAFDEEKEMDEWARPLITSKEVEKKFRDLYSASHGIEKYRNSFQEVNEKHQALIGSIQELSECVKTGDYDSFLEQCKIPMDQFWKWVDKKLAYYELPEDQRMRYDEAQNLRKQNRELAKSRESSGDVTTRMEGKLLDMELGFILRQPEFSKISQGYDERMGEPGAFKRFVAECGESIEFRTGKKCNPDAALKEATRRLGISPETPAAVPTPAAGNVPGVVTQKGAGGKPVIPSIKGSGSSPVKQKPKSIDEMKEQFAKERAARASGQ